MNLICSVLSIPLGYLKIVSVCLPQSCQIYWTGLTEIGITLLIYRVKHRHISVLIIAAFLN